MGSTFTFSGWYQPFLQLVDDDLGLHFNDNLSGEINKVIGDLAGNGE
jgi:hypothetical protein